LHVRLPFFKFIITFTTAKYTINMYIENENREMLLIKDNYFANHLIRREIKALNNILVETESLRHFGKAVEMLDCRRNKVILELFPFLRVLYNQERYPFIFIIMKN